MQSVEIKHSRNGKQKNSLFTGVGTDGFFKKPK